MNLDSIYETICDAKSKCPVTFSCSLGMSQKLKNDILRWAEGQDWVAETKTNPTDYIFGIPIVIDDYIPYDTMLLIIYTGVLNCDIKVIHLNF